MSPLVLLGIGIVIMIAEMLFGSFFLFFIGVGFCITAAIEYMIGFGHFGNVFVWQCVSICCFSLITLLCLRKPIKARFTQAQGYKDKLEEGGEGEIRQGMVYFKGTLWHYESDGASDVAFTEGEKVQILKIQGNKAIITKS